MTAFDTAGGANGTRTREGAGHTFEVVLVTYRSRAHVEELVGRWGTEVPVALVDNGSGVDGLIEWAAQRPQVRYLDGGGVGFARAANIGAFSSEAEFVVFVNPDSRPTVADLRALVEGLAADPVSASHAATMAGADGDVEIGVAGWEPDVWRTTAYAAGLHKRWPRAGVYAKPEIGERLAVDWTTGACMAVRTVQFRRLGGFDESFFVYSEDMSFGRRAREAGLRQVLRPDVVVAHGAGSSGAPSAEMMRLKGASFRNYVHRYHPGVPAAVMSGTLAAGYLARSAQKRLTGGEMAPLFLAQAAGLLTGRASVGGREVARARMEETAPAARRAPTGGAPEAGRRPILLVTKEFGEPATSGGMLRTLAIARWLARRANVVVVAPTGVTGVRRLPGSDEIVLEPLRQAPRRSLLADALTLPRYRSVGAPRTCGAALLTQVSDTLRVLGPFGVAVVDHTCLFGVADLLPDDLPVVLSTHNVESDLMRQRAGAESGPMKVAAHLEAGLLRRLERTVGSTYPTVVCTEHDGEVAREDGAPAVAVARNGVTPPTGLDRARAVADNPLGTELLFTGALDWRPNVGGILWLVESPQWARFVETHPGVVLTVAGRNPSDDFRARLEAAPGVRVEADVPSMRPLLERARLGVAPLLEGGGSRIKLLEYVAHGLPSVSTVVGASGLDGLPEDAIVQTPENLDAFCAAVDVALCEGPTTLPADQVEAMLAVYGWTQALEPAAAVLPGAYRG
ncbi:glycosyltransferase [Mobilicoccus pelagius]|uniref:Putative glycosyltransferase n=1 Tax=Mobilicoccus pelagius NBRC 104925 TaxID=1089455 RepID=H5UPT3_9MICO|nr:glycosyltransferase [Mobilicoccus pelagius]GAB47738.1 putative glycosyltransferase [Mobilicoccus pelagius NBRC 104925]